MAPLLSTHSQKWPWALGQKCLPLASWNDMLLIKPSHAKVLGNGCFQGEEGAHMQSFYKAVFAWIPASEMRPGTHPQPKPGGAGFRARSEVLFSTSLSFGNASFMLSEYFAYLVLEPFFHSPVWWHFAISIQFPSWNSGLQSEVPRMKHWGVARKYVSTCFYFFFIEKY